MMVMFDGNRISTFRTVLRVGSIAATTVAFFGAAIILGYVTAGRAVPVAYFALSGAAVAVSFVLDFIAPKAKK